MLDTATLIVFISQVYLLIGFIFALYFVIWGIRGPSIAGRSLRLRLMIIPGAMMLWPLLLRKRKTP